MAQTATSSRLIEQTQPQQPNPEEVLRLSQNVEEQLRNDLKLLRRRLADLAELIARQQKQLSETVSTSLESLGAALKDRSEALQTKANQNKGALSTQFPEIIKQLKDEATQVIETLEKKAATPREKHAAFEALKGSARDALTISADALKNLAILEHSLSSSSASPELIARVRHMKKSLEMLSQDLAELPELSLCANEQRDVVRRARKPKPGYSVEVN